MQWQHIENQWNLYRHKAKKRWDRLSDAELSTLGGKFDGLIDSIQTCYQMPRTTAEQEVWAWIDTFGGEYGNLPGEGPLLPRVRKIGAGKSHPGMRRFGPYDDF